MKFLSQTTNEVLELCRSLPEDANLKTVYVCSYPKSGTTWLQALIYNLLSNGDQKSLEHISYYSPFYEIGNTWQMEEKKIALMYTKHHQSINYRVFNTHLLPDMLPQPSANVKYVYIVRGGAGKQKVLNS